MSRAASAWNLNHQAAPSGPNGVVAVKLAAADAAAIVHDTREVTAALHGLPELSDGHVTVTAVSTMTADEVARRLGPAASPHLIGIDEFSGLLGGGRQLLDWLRTHDSAFPTAAAHGVWPREAAQEYAASG